MGIKTNKNAANSESSGHGPVDLNQPLQNDILVLLNIPRQTSIPDAIMTAPEAESVKFQISEPQGYLFDDVESWHKAVVRAINWYQDALHKRDLQVVGLATEFDRSQVDLTNTIYEREYLAGGALETVSFEAHQASLARIDELTRYITSLEGQSNENPLSEGERMAFEELQLWAEQAEKAYALLQDEYAAVAVEGGGATSSEEVAALRQELDVEKAAHIASMELLQQAQNYANELDEYINQVAPILDAYQGGEANSEGVREVENVEYDVPELPLRSTSMPGAHETAQEAFDRMMSDINGDYEIDSDAPELGEGVRFVSDDDQLGYANPGDPLKTVPDGADINEY